MGKRFLHRLDDLDQFGGEGAAVGVAQYQVLGPSLQGRRQGAQGVVPVFLEGVEEVLGVVKQLLHPGFEVAQRAGDELQVALRRGLEDLLDLEQGRLAEDGHHRRQTDEELLHVGVGFRRPVLVMGAAEGGDAA